MNLIQAKLESLLPGYIPHTNQAAEIRTSRNPQIIADSIDAKMAALSALAERHWGPGVAETIDLLAALTLRTPHSVNPKTAPVGFLLNNASKARLFELGQRASKDTVATMYRDILGRWPDAEGRMHYESQLAAGRPRWEIVREIELSDEALAR